MGSRRGVRRRDHRLQHLGATGGRHRQPRQLRGACPSMTVAQNQAPHERWPDRPLMNDGHGTQGMPGWPWNVRRAEQSISP
jgi:hypothetical protein